MKAHIFLDLQKMKYQAYHANTPFKSIKFSKIISHILSWQNEHCTSAFRENTGAFGLSQAICGGMQARACIVGQKPVNFDEYLAKRPRTISPKMEKVLNSIIINQSIHIFFVQYGCKVPSFAFCLYGYTNLLNTDSLKPDQATTSTCIYECLMHIHKQKLLTDISPRAQ